MLKLLPLLLPVSLLAAVSLPSTAAPLKESPVISKGEAVVLTNHLLPEKPTLFIFLKPNSTLERDFLETLQKEARENVGVRVIELKTGAEPVAAKYAIKETPTAMVYDRRGRLVARSSDAKEIQTALKKAAGVMRIDWAEEGDANFEGSVKALGRSPGVGILRTMTLQP